MPNDLCYNLYQHTSNTTYHHPHPRTLHRSLKSKGIIHVHGDKRRLFLLLPQLLLDHPLELVLERKGRLIHLYLLVLLPLQHLHFLIVLLGHAGFPFLVHLLVHVDAIDILEIIILYLPPSFLFLFCYL